MAALGLLGLLLTVLQPIPLRILPVSYDAMVSACRALPGDLVLARHQRSPDGASTSLLSAANSGVVIALWKCPGRCIDKQGEKACQLSCWAGHRGHFAGFIKIVRDVRY